MLPGATLARTLARTGVDWICVDCEHGNIADADMHNATHAIASCGVSPIVRVPGKEDWMVKRALDAGAHGVVCPLLKSVQDVKDFVASCKFPPGGTRGFGSMFPLEAFRKADGTPPNAYEYLTQANGTILTIAQIETKEALENVEEIAAIDGLDVLFVGPFDLGNNIGRPLIPTMHDDLRAAIERVRVAAEKAGKWSGFFCGDGQQSKAMAAKGFNMVSVVTDASSLQGYISGQIAAAKGS